LAIIVRIIPNKSNDFKFSMRGKMDLLRYEITRWRDVKRKNQGEDVGVIRGGSIDFFFLIPVT